MPNLSRFSGTMVRMFAEVGAQHHVPHFHAYFHGDVGIFAVEPIQIIAGSLPEPETQLVLAWAAAHQNELVDAWRTLQEGRIPRPIEPPK